MQLGSSCSRVVSGTGAAAGLHRRRLLRHRSPAAVSAAAAPTSSSSSLQPPQQQQQHGVGRCRQAAPLQQQQRRACSGRSGSVACAAAAAPSMASLDVDELVGPTALEPEVFEVVTYALKLAWTAETYYVHSWMLLLGLLKKERCVACEVLQELGLTDLYGAWNEVLWALNVADGLTPRAFAPRMTWGERASAILQGSVRYGLWAGRDRVSSADLLMALAASDVLTSLFPDLDLSWERVRRAVEKRTGTPYAIPGLDDGDAAGGGVALTSQDNFL